MKKPDWKHLKPNFQHLESAARWTIGCGALVALVSALAQQPEVMLSALPRPDLVVAAGTEVMLGGVATKISGFDRCPGAGYVGSEAYDAVEARSDCIRLVGDWIRVEYEVNGQPKQEALAVVHEFDRESLRRADGSPVFVMFRENAAEIESESLMPMPGVAL